jgi:hypothetical protein
MESSLVYFKRIPSIRIGCKPLILQQPIISGQVIKNQKNTISMKTPNPLKQIKERRFLETSSEYGGFGCWSSADSGGGFRWILAAGWLSFPLDFIFPQFS